MSDAAMDELNQLLDKGKIRENYHPDDASDHDRAEARRQGEADDAFNLKDDNGTDESSTDGASPRRRGGASRPASIWKGLRRAARRAGSDDNDGDDDELKPATAGSFGRSKPAYNVPRKRYYGNTGVKGVIADAQAYEDALAKRRLEKEREKRQQQRIQAGPSGYQPGEAERDSDDSDTARLDNDDDDGLDDDDGDDDFMVQWRQKRMKELRDCGQPKARGLTVAKGLVPVDQDGFLEITDRPGLVVVYIYDQMGSLNYAFEEPLQAVADRNPATKFVSITGRETGIPEVALPSLAAYRNGRQVACLVPLVDYLPDDDGELDADMMEAVLREHNII